jgi:hypothetical protein
MNITMPGEEVRPLSAYEIDFVSGGAYGVTLPSINVSPVINVGGPTVNVGNQIGISLFGGTTNQVQLVANNLYKSILGIA